MRTNRLLLIGMMVGFTAFAGACKGGSVGGGTGAGGPPRIPGLGDSPGFGGVSDTGSTAGRVTPSLAPTPGFGGPSGSGSNAGTATPSLAPSPGFGGPSGAAGGAAPSGGGVSSGIPSSQPVSELSASEVAQLCAALLQRSRQELGSGGLARFSCTLSAVSSASSGTGQVDVAACEDAVAECLASGQGGSLDAASCSTSELTATFAECDASVGEVENCLNARFAQLGQLTNAFTCSNASDPQAVIATLGSSSNLPAACSSLASRCPGLVGSMPDVEPTRPPTTGTAGCTDTCRDADDGFCDDGGDGAFTQICALGTDCTDCGPR